MPTFYKHDINNVHTALPSAWFTKHEQAATSALSQIKTWYDTHTLPLLRLPERDDDITALRPIVTAWQQQFSTVVILGTGGSSLGGQTLNALADKGFGAPKGCPKLVFLDNVDPVTFDALFAAISLEKTGFIVISKSGSTAETLTQFLICLQRFQAQNLGTLISKNFLAITEPKDSVLTRLTKQHGIQCLDHDPLVGGRFSVLSIVGMLPAMLAGLDAHAIRQGAKSVLQDALAGNAKACAPAMGAAASIALQQHKNISQTVLMPYLDQLAYFGMWYRQLWAESLGKKGKGITPIRAMGTVDQHSQLQLYLDGPKDKMFTVLMADVARTGDKVMRNLAQDKALDYLQGRTMGDLLDAEQRATAETLIANNCPVRLITIGTLDEATMGALLMHFMLETIIAAHILEIDAFDQPAVEQGKILAREYMQSLQAA
jgi:glucose-6-phosphate isomerase